MLRKFARFEVLSAQMGGQTTTLSPRVAHRHNFQYTPRPGFLYVRSRAISSRTNDNFDHFPADEIKQAYRTFVGKPVFVNHHNDNHRRARGVVIDAALHEDVLADGSQDTWCEVLMEISATKFPKLCEAILKGKIDRTSMGCDVAYSVCSVCNNKASTPLEYCRHIPAMKGQKVRRKNAATGSNEDVLVYEKCYGLKFFENSVLVEDPADPTAYFLEVDDRGLGGGYEGNVPRMASVAGRVQHQIDRPSQRQRLADASVGQRHASLAGQPLHVLPVAGAHGAGVSRGGDRTAGRADQDYIVSNDGDGWTIHAGPFDNADPRYDLWVSEQLAKHPGATVMGQESVDSLAPAPRMAAKQLTVKVDGKTYTRSTDADYTHVSFKDGAIAWHTSEEAARRRSSEVYPVPKAESSTDSNWTTEKPSGAPDTCTVGPSATSGERCGQPAVAWTKDGSKAECADHKPRTASVNRTAAVAQWVSTGPNPWDGYFEGHQGHEIMDVSVSSGSKVQCETCQEVIAWFGGDSDQPYDYIPASISYTPTAVRRTATFDHAHVSRTLEEYLGHYNGTVSWLLQHKPDATAEQVTEVLLDRDSSGVRKLLGGRDPWVKDQAEWKPILVTKVQEMLDAINASPTTAMKRTAAKGDPGEPVTIGDDFEPTIKSHGDHYGLYHVWVERYRAIDQWTGKECEVDSFYQNGGMISSDGPLVKKDGTLGARSTAIAPPIPKNVRAVLAEAARGGTTASLQRVARLQRLAYGEVSAPAEVDTMRDNHCPVCGEEEGFNGDTCSVCQFVKPPDEFMDPDLSVAQETDLRQQQDKVGDPDNAETDGTEVTDEEDGPQVPSDGQFKLEKPGEELGEEEIDADGQIDGDVDTAPEVDAEEAAEDDKDPSDDSDDEIGEDEDDDDDDDAPFKLKKKKSTRRHLRDPQKEQSMRPTLKALAEQQILLEANKKAIQAIANVAGLNVAPFYDEADRRTAALRKQADEENPAQPVSEPAPEAPAVTTDEALGDLDRSTGNTPDDVTEMGTVSETDVAPDATTDVTAPGGTGAPTEAELGELNELDVTRPTEGTTEMRPDDEVKPDSDVKARGFDSETAYPIDALGSQNEGRTFASLRLARLRIEAGIAEVQNDLALGATIAASELTDDAIQGEILTLTKVQAAKVAAPPAPAGGPAPRVAARATPSMGAPAAPAGESGGGLIGGNNTSAAAAVDDAIL